MHVTDEEEEGLATMVSEAAHSKYGVEGHAGSVNESFRATL